MGRIHLLSHVVNSEVNDSWPIGSGHYVLKGPSDFARDFNWIIPLILVHIPISDLVSHHIGGHNLPRLVEFKIKGSGTKIYKGDQKCVCDRFLEKWLLESREGD